MNERATEHDVEDASAQVIREAVHRLVEAADPVKVILFGSFARGDNAEGSDLDLLVILRTVTDRHTEMVRLQRALVPLSLPTDILVYSVDEVQRRGHLRVIAPHRSVCANHSPALVRSGGSGGTVY